MEINTRSKNMIWRVIDVINWAVQYFKQQGFDHPRREIEWLLQDLLESSRIDLYLRFEDTLSQQELHTLHAWIKRRLKHEPLQYITGQAEFYGRKFIIDKNVFIPRPETEKLVEVTLQMVNQDDRTNILDVGTGCGCIALTLASELSNAQVVGIDASKMALNNAQKNKEVVNVKNIQFELMDFLCEIPANKYSIIVANPPYIPEMEVNDLMVDVKNFEPHDALTDYSDGMKFYIRLIEVSEQIMEKKGWMVLELGLGNHPQKVMHLFKHSNFKKIELIKDLNGDDRIVKAQLA
jgi:release factor glutamine methyltransferase